MNWYDRAEDYDALYSWDPAAERDFILGASERYGIAAPARFLEPFCGSGRLLRAMPGTAIGFDVNPHMVRFAARTSRVFRADAARFGVAKESFDAAFCLIDSFRYLTKEADARRHLGCVARALRPGGIYVLGIELAGDASTDSWSAGGFEIAVGMLGDADPHTRVETFRARIRVDGEEFESFAPMRTYTAPQAEALVAAEGSFALAATFDRGYDLEKPVAIERLDGSIVMVLRKRGGA